LQAKELKVPAARYPPSALSARAAGCGCFLNVRYSMAELSLAPEPHDELDAGSTHIRYGSLRGWNLDHARPAIDSSPTRLQRHPILVGHISDLHYNSPLAPGIIWVDRHKRLRELAGPFRVHEYGCASLTK
jgi:hypothetical protein